MAHVERDIFIQASAADIVNYMGNPANVPEWYEGVVEASSDQDSPVVGGVVKQVYTAAGSQMEMTMTVTEYKPEETLIFNMEGMISGTFRWDFTPEGDGTRLKGTVDYKMAGGFLGAIADKLVVERMNVSQLEESLENLKRIIEG